MPEYSEPQLRALALVPKLTASLSMPCNFFIISEVIRDHRRKRGRPVDRAILGMSIIDVLASSGWFFSTWLVPAGSPNALYAFGTTQTCSYQGFLLQIAIGAPLYNCSLALYYLLSIRHGWTNTDLTKIEPWLHGCIVAFAFGTGIAGVVLNLYNQVTAVCWISGLPEGCYSSTFRSDGVPCDRGQHAWIYGLAWFYIPLWICIFLTLVAMLLICLQVRETLLQSRRHDFVERVVTRRSSVRGRITKLRNQSFLRSNDVAKQAVLYSVCFFITWMPSTIWSVTGWNSSPKYWLDFLAAFCEPLQGFLNFLVFIRPRKDIRVRLIQKLSLIFCFFQKEKQHHSQEDSMQNRSLSRTSNSPGFYYDEFHPDDQKTEFDESLKMSAIRGIGQAATDSPAIAILTNSNEVGINLEVENHADEFSSKARVSFGETTVIDSINEEHRPSISSA